MLRRLHTIVTGGSRRGYAILMFLIVLLVLSLLLSSVVAAGDASGRQALASAKRLDARALAVAGLEEFYTELLARPGLANNTISMTHPALRKSATDTNWGRFAGSQVVSCPTDTTRYNYNCFYITLDTSLQRTRTDSVVAEIVTRVSCNGSAQRCGWARYQQRLNRVQFFDYMYFNETSGLDPELYRDVVSASEVNEYMTKCIGSITDRQAATLPAGGRCMEISYLGNLSASGNDTFDGPVYSADDYILVCGNPVFRSQVSVAGYGWLHSNGTRRVWRSATDFRADTCAATSSSTAFPQGDTGVNYPLLTMPDALTSYEQATTAELPDGAQRVLIQPTLNASGQPNTVSMTLSASGTGASARTRLTLTNAVIGGVGTSSLTLSAASALVAVRGPVSLRGQYSGQLTLFARDGVSIDADLQRTEKLTGVTNVRGDGGDVLAVVAGTRIRIEPLCRRSVNGTSCAAAAPRQRLVEALLVALSGSVYTPGWGDDPSLPTWGDGSSGTLAPKLSLFGAIAGKYQGPFAGYAVFAGWVRHGFVKDFRFDSRATDGVVLPPLLVSPNTTRFQRVDLTELPVSAAILTTG